MPDGWWIWAIILGGVLVKVLFFKDEKDMFGALTKPETDDEAAERRWRRMGDPD